MIPETFNCNPPSAAADGNSSTATTSETNADQAGALNAKPRPIINTQNRRTLGLKSRSEPSTAGRPAANANQRFTHRRSFRRWTMSAKTPAGSVKRNNDRDATIDIIERESAEELSVFITHTAAV